MKNLADSVLDYFWFLEFSEEDECDPDLCIDLLESLVYEIDKSYTTLEKQELRDAAARRLQYWLQEPDEHGYTPRKLLKPDQKKFLENMIAGRFNQSDEEEE